LSLFLVFCSRMVSTPSCIGPGSPRPCMSRCPGNPRHLSVDSIRASALLGPTSVPPCVWRGHRSHGPSARAPQQDGGRLRMGRRCHGGAGTAAPRWSRPPQTKPSGARPPLHRPMKKSVGREPFTAHWREGFLFISPLCSELIAALQPQFQGFWRRHQPGVAYARPWGRSHLLPRIRAS
jgi:hypothetical protein